MKRASCFVLIFILLFLSSPINVFALPDGEEHTYGIDSGYAGLFLSDSAIYSGMEIADVRGEYLQLSVSRAGAYIRFECDAERNGILSNAIRLVIDTPSNCGILNVEIEYLDGGETRTAFEELQTGNRSGKKIYYIDFEYASDIRSVTVSSQRILSDHIKLYSLTREYVYRDNTDYVYSGGSNVRVELDPSLEGVLVSGTIGHGTVTKYSGSQLELYRLNVGENVSEALRAGVGIVDSKPISIQFKFDVRTSDISELYSCYMVAICTPDGERIPLESPSMPSNTNKKPATSSDEDTLKGLHSEFTADAIEVNPSLAVIDVDLSKLENPKNNGYYFVSGNKYYYFDREYVSGLDNKLKAYTDIGCKVYLRFFSDMRSAIYEREKDYFSDLYAYSSYLAQRYNGGDHGAFCGIIVGNKLDGFAPKTNSEVNSCLAFYAAYLHIISEAVHIEAPSVKIFASVSDVESIVGYEKNHYSCEQLLLSLGEVMNDICSSPPEISVMLCGDHIPLGINESVGEGAEAFADKNLYRYYNTEKISDFELMIGSVNKKNNFLCKEYSYFWTPEQGLSGSVLTAAYAYNYFKLAFESSAQDFIASLDSERVLYDLKHVLKYINTSKFSNAVAPSLEILGARTWNELIPSFRSNEVEQMRLYEMSPVDIASLNIKGSRDMWRFSELNSTGSWYSLNGCSSMSINVSSEFGRSLVVKMKPYNEIQGQYSGILYAFGGGKNISFFDYITYTLGIGCESTTAEVFEIKLLIGSEKEKVEVTQIVKAGSLNDITVDTRILREATYMQISVKPISNQDIPYNLYLGKITGHSESHTSEKLEELDEREGDGEEDNGNIFSDAPITETAILLLCVIIAFIAVGTVIIFKKVDKNNKQS